ncbi:hypothetical protein [Fimbriimonas ginsengisoli]|uniref:LTD domain-containing protein n=1 Tax=Fimbriimonas ginsengisoli Gsoil 348 TaxID=661478 RepID=A0A068NUC4_FIMGI|nr:hypothetical protein [Fimbriimonas ginsengisoli]AIE86380.1 hypothetical protein OP10G_3012 [Fimbriimonas ginsengisoli Gsoil 348]
MIRIVGVQRHESPQKEFILLQNQGSLRINLKGHVIASESAIANSDLSFAAHAFPDEALIPPGMYVLLSTGSGESRWTKTKEGALLYYAYMNRETPVWFHTNGAVHVLSLQHTYADRGPALLLR